MIPSLANGMASKRIAECIAVEQQLLRDGSFLELLEATALRVSAAVRAGRKVLFMGNGGSAADAQHLAAEFTGRYMMERRALPAIALNANASEITAIANDYSFDRIFARQIEALGQPGDVAIGLSTSGNSDNVVLAMQTARVRNLLTVALTGSSGGLLKNEVEVCLRVPSAVTPRIQECHILVGHILCEIVEHELCK
ncbi:MAG: D-sedoheptulose 7-phosphate isomerase [Candidatus Korobacteraceae bacterium]